MWNDTWRSGAATRPRRQKVGVAGTVAVALLLAGCGGGSDASGGSGESVPAGAEKQEFIGALADMEPVELSISSNQAPGQGFSVAVENYAEAVEEWSGGKITFEIIYSGAVAPITEASQAMADGLMDMGMWSYGELFDTFPIAAATQETFFLHDTAPLTGTLELLAAAVEQGANEDLREEIKSQGLQPLLSLLPISSAVILCKGDSVTSAEEANGKSIRAAGGSGLADELSAVGFTPVDVPFAEAYDAMQRGVTDCEGAPITSVLATGQLEIADHLTFSEGTSFTASPGAFDMSLEVWEELPLAAQQLLFDRLDAFLVGYSQEGQLDSPAEALAVAKEHGVEFHTWSADDLEALEAHHEKKLEEMAGETFGGVDGQTIVEDARAAHEKWSGIIADLGYDDSGVSWEEYPAWLEENDVDLQPLFEQVVQEALGEYRPE